MLAIIQLGVPCRWSFWTGGWNLGLWLSRAAWLGLLLELLGWLLLESDPSGWPRGGGPDFSGLGGHQIHLQLDVLELGHNMSITKLESWGRCSLLFPAASSSATRLWGFCWRTKLLIAGLRPPVITRRSWASGNLRPEALCTWVAN